VTEISLRWLYFYRKDQLIDVNYKLCFLSQQCTTSDLFLEKITFRLFNLSSWVYSAKVKIMRKELMFSYYYSELFCLFQSKSILTYIKL
jgi:hypothetical protein